MRRVSTIDFIHRILKFGEQYIERLEKALRRLPSVLFLSIMLVALMSVLPSGISQTSFSTITSTLTSQVSANATSYSSTITSIITSTTSLMVNETVSSYSTYNSTSTITSAPESSTVTAAPSMDTNSLLLLAVNVLVAVFLIFAIIRYVKRRRK